VFHQFSGGMGPSGIAVSPAGVLYVSRYDHSGCRGYGRVAALDLEGNLLEEYTLPHPELTGIAYSDGVVYVTESSTNSVFSLHVAMGK
jgi:sugar lactone lactonase YvrE